MPSLKERLIEILIKNKLITQEQLNESIEYQKSSGSSLRDIIISHNFVKENDLISALSEGLNFPLIDLKRFKIDPEIAKIIPVDIARHYQIIPVSKIGDTITLSMADPLNIFAIDAVETLTGYKINPIISSSQDIIQAVEQVYSEATKDLINGLVKEMSDATLEFIKEEKDALPTDSELTFVSREAPVIKVTNMILETAVKKKASDILIEPWEKKMRLRYRIDGVLQEEQSPPKSMHPLIVSRIKVMSELNIAEHRLPQDGRFKAKLLGREVDFRISVLPASFGEKVAIRILDKSQATLDVDKLGFSDDIAMKLKKMAKLPHGMILVCGPTGSGKTTTLYSILKFTDSPQKNLVTVEDPVEFQLEGINQVTIKPDIGLTFASSLRAILRQDPNVIMIGEIRDFETMDIAIKSALTGHLVLSTLHTTTACGAIVRLINMGVEPFLINSSVNCVVAQRLIRKVCSHCRQEYEIDQAFADTVKIKIGAGKKIKFFRGKGCQYCFNLGYAGRVGIAEALILSSQVRDLILGRAQEYVIKQLARKEGMRTLREEGVELALLGVTSLEEVLRVTAPDES